MEQDLVIWRHCNIGALDAETDQDLLSRCYVDNGYLELLADPENTASIILGRTGSGKSATLIRLAQLYDNVINISPTDLAFKYVENSTVLSFFREAGVNLDIFYRLLWRHVLITELLRARYGWDNEGAVSAWFDSIFQRFKRDQAKSRAFRYLQDWGDKFWLETEVRVKEVTEKVEADLKASMSASACAAKMTMEGGATLSEEEKSEVVNRGSSVVNKIQLKELTKLLSFLAEEVFDDRQKPFYVVIDNLDENWVDSSSKFLLIRSLIEEIKVFRKIKNVKIIIVLRQDLLEKVYNETRDGGFQEEKYEAYYAPIKWREKDLETMVDLRLNEIFKRKYTGRKVGVSDVLPKDRGGNRSLTYIFERTFLRPRDVMSFVNECLKTAEGKTRITWSVMHNAEERYSQKRLRSVLDEWTQLFPSLKHILCLVRGLPESFCLVDVQSHNIDAAILGCASESIGDELTKIAIELTNPGATISVTKFVAEALVTLYHVGILGIKSAATSPFAWVYRDGRKINVADLTQDSHFRIHKMFWREFGIGEKINPYKGD